VPAWTYRIATGGVDTAIEEGDCLWLQRGWAQPQRPDLRPTGLIGIRECSATEAYTNQSSRDFIPILYKQRVGELRQMDKEFWKACTTDLMDGNLLTHASKTLEGLETCPGALIET
jgi:hypothetical protein